MRTYPTMAEGRPPYQPVYWPLRFLAAWDGFSFDPDPARARQLDVSGCDGDWVVAIGHTVAVFFVLDGVGEQQQCRARLRGGLRHEAVVWVEREWAGHPAGGSQPLSLVVLLLPEQRLHGHMHVSTLQRTVEQWIGSQPGAEGDGEGAIECMFQLIPWESRTAWVRDRLYLFQYCRKEVVAVDGGDDSDDECR